MRVLIVGLGSVGRRHLANLEKVVPSARTTVWRLRPRAERGDETPARADAVVGSLEEALATKPDAALITGPAPLHVETGLALARAGVHLFIEKPLSDTLKGVDALIELCRVRDLVLMVGYNLRFYRPLQVMRHALVEGSIGRPLSVRAEVGQFLPDWRPGTDYRRGVSARRDLGGGAVLELSHELDYVRWLVGEVATVSAKLARVSDLDIDVEDTAEVTLGFENGVIGGVHLDMVQRAPVRTCRVAGTEGTLEGNFLRHHVRLFSAATSSWRDLHPPAEIDRNDMYESELSHFFDCVKSEERPYVGGEDGRRIVELALAIKRSSEERRAITVRKMSVQAR